MNNNSLHHTVTFLTLTISFLRELDKTNLVDLKWCVSEITYSGAETACQMWGGGGLGVHEVGSYLLLYTFILNTSSIGY